MEVRGTIARLRLDKGYGFINADDGRLFFVHRSGVRGVFELLREGQRVRFIESQGDNAKGPRAAGVVVEQ